MSTKKKALIAGLIFTLFLSLFGAHHFLLPKKQPPKVSYHLNLLEERRTILLLPHYLAMNLGFFKEQNLRINLQTIDSEQLAHQLLAENNADVILASPAQSILVQLAIPSKIPVAIAAISQKDGSFLISRDLNKSFQWNNVQNRTIISGFPTEDTSLILEHILRQHDITPNWQTNVIENLPGPLRIGTFISGSGSFILAEEPDASQLAKINAGKIVSALGEEEGTIPALVYLTTPENIDSKGPELQALVNGLCKAQQWLALHSTKEAANQVKEFFPGWDSPTLISAIEKYRSYNLWPKKPIIDKTSYLNLYQTVENTGEMANDVSFSKAINNTFGRKAVKEVHYSLEKKKPQPKFSWEYLKSLFS